ncbi:hypothetical protein P154DRAFT_622966 [Amniculicola lignicola CBS 123094]|uniref:Serine/threonine-protein kinase Tel1 n=1 Tax=Amniculicola lignicola CBS 123094 TaxID=1392246 RepID=A0A6A5W4H7_9PLEO|nr:hypothetical protein P154DRAFT_622966 [Amniculicola lignicola CBS 123094]
MGATNIQDAKVLISSTKVVDRSTGLKDLIHILKHNHGKPSLEGLTNKAYLSLCETLFQCVRDERASWLRSRTKAAKTSPLLPLSATALRTVVNSGVRAIKSSTVEQIIETVIEVLPGTNGAGFIDPLLEDLPKVLRALVEYQPHVERLSKDCWEAIVDFCISSLAKLWVVPEAEPQDSWASSTRSGRGRTPFDSTEATSKTSSRDPSKKTKHIPDGLVHSAEDFVTCLQLLTKASNAPVLETAEAILATLVLFLQRKIGRGHAVALAAVNHVVARLSLHSIELTKRTVCDLLPLMKTLWSDVALRDEILVLLTQTEPHLASILADPHEDAASLDIEILIETIYAEYRRRQENAALQFLEHDHLCFRYLGRAHAEIHPLHTAAFSLEAEQMRSEGLWSTVALTAHFSFLLDKRKRSLPQDREDAEEALIKRLRITHLFHEYLRHLAEPKSNAKIAALQVTAFMVQQGPMDEEDLQITLEKLIPYIADQKAVHSTWALLAITAAAFQLSSKSVELQPLWITAWQSASRAVTSVSSSRAACHLMDVLLRLKIVPFVMVSETVQSFLLSIELSGPGLLTETSASLLTTIIKDRVAENPTHYNQTAERVLNWLLTKWTPSLFPERNYSSHNAQHCSASDILRLLHACLDRPFIIVDPSPFISLGPIGQAQVQVVRSRDLSNYLLLLPEPTDFQIALKPELDQPAESLYGHHPTQFENRVLEFCILELEKTKQRWKDWTQFRPQGITSNMLRGVASFCIVVTALASAGDPEDRRTRNLESLVDTLSQSLAAFVGRRDTDQYKVDAVLEIMMGSLPDVRLLKDMSLHTFKEAGIFFLANHMSKAISDRMDGKESFYVEDEDFMDVDQAPASQTTKGTFQPEVDVPRHELSAETDITALRSSCVTYLHLISLSSEQPDDQNELNPSFVGYLVSLSEAELIRSRQFIRALLSGNFHLTRTSCLNLLERMVEALLDPSAREYNTSEVANGLVVDVLHRTTRVWDPASTDPEGQTLFDIVTELYSYYAKDMEKSSHVRRSANLQRVLADFLHELLKHQPDFITNHNSPSVRTSLFQILTRGEISVKYHIADRLPSIFEDFVLTEHDKILQDVDSSLPNDITWMEGIAIRLLVLARLASRWHTLLRQAVYHVFATAGNVKGAVNHAQRCIALVAKARSLPDSQTLFRLFAPQIIFTWLDRNKTFAEIPFSTFDYATPEDLLLDIESEAVGQAMMRGLEKEIEYLAKVLGTSKRELLLKNIGKAAAYTISWDTCKGSARDKATPSNAMRLRDLIGHEEYLTQIQVQYPKVLGHILETVGNEEKINKALEKRPAYATAAKSLTAMMNISQSGQGLDLGIEPSFSAFYLFDQLERLWRRLPRESTVDWLPSDYTFAMRMLLDRLHPALGSLYARSIIRKIRILVALAGEVAYTGYPLQMTLQSLRPFLTDVQCAEDTLGIIQYLFERGAYHLRLHLNFVTGIGLSILISTRVFLGSTQESTTQQSQHIETMNKAQRFRGWFIKYLQVYTEGLSGNERNSHIKAFKQITSAAAGVRTEGNSTRESAESTLLLGILEDVRSGRKLLNNTSREVALNLLCRNFQPAPTAQLDVLASDSDLALYAPQVWESCQRSNVGNGYLLWAARVLGRAFSAHGEVQRGTNQYRPWSGQTDFSDEPLGKRSRKAIVKSIVDLFYSDDRKHVGLAENSVRLLISRLSKDDSYQRELENVLPEPIFDALNLPNPTEQDSSPDTFLDTLEQCAFPKDKRSVSTWVRDLAVSLCQVASQDPILGSLSQLLLGINQMAEQLFPNILHLVLLQDFERERTVRETLSEACMNWFSDCSLERAPYIRILIGGILYLRSQPVPKEATRVDRDHWLEINHLKASHAATVCGNYRTALLFAETSSGQPVLKASSRRSSVRLETPKMPLELQLSIYKNLDEPDSFYGVDRGFSLDSVLDRLDYEGDGIKSLLFRGAHLDSQIRRTGRMDPTNSRGLIKSLITVNMNNITHSLLSSEKFRDMGDDVIDSTLHTARKLAQWDIKAPEGNHTESSTLFKAFQGLHYATDIVSARTQLDRQFLATVKFLSGKESSILSTKARLRTLAVLAEADEVITTTETHQLLDVWDQIKARDRWMRAGDFDDVRLLLSCRETLFSVLSSNPGILQAMRSRAGTLRNIEVEALVSTSTLSRKHGALQEALASVTYLSDIVPLCKSVGLADIEATAQNEAANVLWDQGEAETSIRMRQHLIEHAKFDSQNSHISLPVLLAKLGHHRAEARLAQPNEIIEQQLEPAIRELKGQTQGTVAGQVFHEFALFCDKQLQSPEAAEDLARAKNVMEQKQKEYNDFYTSSTTDKSKSMRETYRRSAGKALNWFKLDQKEYERLRKAREALLRQCLENYLLSLHASDEFNNDALRVFSLWLEYSDTTQSKLVNEAVKKHIDTVPSGKFALLMNQLSSRLQAEDTEFQTLVYKLVVRICQDHPYHGMHQIFAIQLKMSAVSREDAVRSKDESAKSRQRAATQIALELLRDSRSSRTWNKIQQSNELYHHLAMFKNESNSKQGQELSLDKFQESKALLRKIPALQVPPATLQIEVRSDANYDDLPTIASFKPRMSIANGLSAPKVITAIGSDGKPYKQLFKSGNDDLRQDAIMEQVFDQVSRLLKNHTTTRLRNLGIRTYKVLPLSTRSGLMEFVPNTVPLHMWVMPAHERYYPSDWKSEKCRKVIANCQGHNLNSRVKEWRNVADNFHPVGRYFLLERFEDPDEWFEKRLAYTRSTAAISILGHVLGLGDRHCHNILLDQKSGEVVHIDLGVSFEAGRVLPVPEVVPFRLTRDLVDAMGYTKTEGVFRRCCEFTMDTLREERESIMTLLNVLRFDPLVNWGVAPAKAKRMQDQNQETNVANGTSRAGTVGPGGTPAPPGTGTSANAMAGARAGSVAAGALMDEEKEKEGKKDEAGEAGRALSVVEKKLSKTLSTKATVNELIQAATDERNLAVLYMGWASYA